MLLGGDLTAAELTKRSLARLGAVREQYRHRVADDSTVVADDDGRLRWWTFGGLRANAVLTAALGDVAPELLDQWTFSIMNVSLRSDASASAVAAALRAARNAFGDDLAGVIPPVTEQAVKKLKFSELLPPMLAYETLAARGADYHGAIRISSAPVRSSPPPIG